MKLRAFTESDWPRAAMLLTSRDVAKTYMLPDFESVEKARPLFDRLMQLSVDKNRYVRAMEAEGEFVGFCNDVERDGDAVWVTCMEQRKEVLRQQIDFPLFMESVERRMRYYERVKYLGLDE